MWNAAEIKRLLEAVEDIARQQKIANLITLGYLGEAEALLSR